MKVWACRATAVTVSAVILHWGFQIAWRKGVLRRKRGQATGTPYGNTVPSTKHSTLRIQDLREGRLIIIGDVHGCNDELKTLLLKLDFNNQVDNLILVGDLVNKGPDSAGVIDTVLAAGGLAVRGNHDDHTLADWHKWRAGHKLKPAKQWISQLSPRHLEYLDSLPFSLYLPNYGTLVVHAGLVPHTDEVLQLPVPQPVSVPSPNVGTSPDGPIPPRWPQVLSNTKVPLDVPALLSGQQLGDLVWMRDLYKEQIQDKKKPTGNEQQQETRGGRKGSTWRSSIKSSSSSHAWASLWPGPQHVFFGHDAKRRLQLHPHATGLDTGCVYGGRLTAVVIPPLHELVTQSASVAEHHLTADWFPRSHVPLPRITRDHLQAEIVGVDAAHVYEKPSQQGD